jgi:hypothetical protein
MRVVDLVFFGAGRARGAVTLSNKLAFALLAVGTMAAAIPSHAAQLEDAAFVDLPWSALPGSTAGLKPLELSIPRVPLVSDADPAREEWVSEPVTTAIGTTLWSGERGTLVFGFALDQEEESDYEPSDRLFGDLRKRYTAVFAFDQPLGFSTSLIFDVLSKDKRRGQREFKVLQIAVSRPFGDDGSLSAGTAVILNGLKPELNIGVRFFLPLDGP